MKKGQWIKYVAVVLTFGIMAGFFWPGMKTQVNATGVEGLAEWVVSVVYNLGAEDDTIKWEEQGPINIYPESGMYNIYITSEKPSREGYEFLCWKKEGDDTNYTADTEPLIIPQENITQNTQIVFIAQWKKLPYLMVNYVVNQEVIASEKLYRTDETDSFELYFPEVGDKEGYIFKGWTYDNETIYKSSEIFKWEKFANMSDITFTAQWEWDGKTIVPNEALALKAGTPYVLSPGTWNVSGDEYSYTSSENGLTFYVGSDGNYTFTKN